MRLHNNHIFFRATFYIMPHLVESTKPTGGRRNNMSRELYSSYIIAQHTVSGFNYQNRFSLKPAEHFISLKNFTIFLENEQRAHRGAYEGKLGRQSFAIVLKMELFFIIFSPFLYLLRQKLFH